MPRAASAIQTPKKLQSSNFICGRPAAKKLKTLQIPKSHLANAKVGNLPVVGLFGAVRRPMVGTQAASSSLRFSRQPGRRRPRHAAASKRHNQSAGRVGRRHGRGMHMRQRWSPRVRAPRPLAEVPAETDDPAMRAMRASRMSADVWEF